MISSTLQRVSDSQPLRFIITGGWNTAFAYLSLAVLYYLFSARIHYFFLLIVSSILNITNAYICHKVFVFRSKGNYVREYFRYYVVYSVPLGIGFIAFPFCIEVLKINFYVTQAIFAVGTLFISYFGHKHVSFRT